MNPTFETSTVVEFGRFRVLPRRREFLVDGRPIQLGGRAFDVLMVLIEASGAVVSKDALMDRVWPGQFVDENSLQTQICGPCSAFAAGRGLIRTIAGRGYQFTGVVRTVSSSSPAEAVAEPSVPVPAVTLRPTGCYSRIVGKAKQIQLLDQDRVSFMPSYMQLAGSAANVTAPAAHPPVWWALDRMPCPGAVL